MPVAAAETRAALQCRSLFRDVAPCCPSHAHAIKQPRLCAGMCYTTRPALSQGISQGVLAVPSLLAALLVVDPYGEVCSTQTHVRAVKDLHSNI